MCLSRGYSPEEPLTPTVLHVEAMRTHSTSWSGYTLWTQKQNDGIWMNLPVWIAFSPTGSIIATEKFFNQTILQITENTSPLEMQLPWMNHSIIQYICFQVGGVVLRCLLGKVNQNLSLHRKHSENSLANAMILHYNLHVWGELRMISPGSGRKDPHHWLFILYLWF